MSLNVSEHTAQHLLWQIRRSMTEREFGRLTVRELVGIYREKKLEHLLKAVR